MPAFEVTMGVTLAAAAFLSGALAVHPFVTYPLSLRLLARTHSRPIRRGVAPGAVAMCVCAYNEQAVIGARVENMLALRGRVPALEILVYVDAASDQTAQVLAPYADRIQIVVSAERLGKTAGMNTLVGMTNAEIIVFSDANVIFADDAIDHLLTPFADPEIGCVCGHLRYLDDQDGSSTAAAGSLYWRLEEHIKALESDTGSAMGADGSIFAIRRALHVAPPAHLIDDLFVSLSILRQGARIVCAPAAMAFETSVSRPAEEFRRKIRIACQAFNVHRALWPQLARLPILDLYKYISHKVLRWLCIFLLGTAWILTGASLMLLAGIAAGCVFFIACAGMIFVAALSTTGWPSRLREILAAFAATGLGVLRSCRGDTFQTWNPPISARRMVISGKEPARA